MGIRVNFADVETKDYDPIPSGTYVAKITDGELRETSGNGKLGVVPMINWEFTLQEDPYAGRKVWTNSILHESTLWNLKGLLVATGRYDEEQLADEMDFEISDVIGADVKVVVGQRTYDGEIRNEVKRVKSVTAGSSKSQSLLP